MNLGIEKSRAPLVVCCHQDVRLPDGWLDRFLGQIARVEDRDRQWGVAGVMGVGFNGAFAGHIRDPHTSRPFGRLPRKVQSLDEVCLAIRRDGGLRFDEGLGGFHLYGADLCLQAGMKGMSCYALDACLEHLSGGKLDESFYRMADRLCAKWRVAPGAPSLIETTCGVFQIGSGIHASILSWGTRLRRKCWRRLQGHRRMKKVLILAYYYPPTGGAGVQRVVKFARYLPGFGYHPAVVSGTGVRSVSYAPMDEMLSREIADVTNYPLPCVQDEGLSPSRWCELAYAKCCEVVASEKPDCVFVSVSPYYAAGVACRVAKRFDLPWILDMRDPWALDPYLAYRTRLHHWADLRADESGVCACYRGRHEHAAIVGSPGGGVPRPSARSAVLHHQRMG